FADDTALHVLVLGQVIFRFANLFHKKCPTLPRTKFADVTAEMYPLGTRLYYECDSGYKRRRGQYSGIWCQSEKEGASWVYQKFECIDEKILLSTAPMMELDFTQKPETKTQSPAPQKRENISEFHQKDFCGPPKTIPHASLSLNRQYYVGQELHFKCQSGYNKRPPTSGTRRCKKVNDKIIWTPLDMRCTNDSDKWPPQTIEPAIGHLLPLHSKVLQKAYLSIPHDCSAF
uniref:Interleukin-2 receptor subunit alpha n=1 Tax=Otus sunia TaxID=257818 RepID=A0A8C8EE97_9STRI